MKNKVLLNILTYIVLIAFLFFFLLPVIVLFSISVKSPSEPITESVLPRGGITFENFETVLKRTDFSLTIRNSFIISISTTALCVFLSSMAAYALSRIKKKFFKYYSRFILVFQMFPLVFLLIPLYIFFMNLHLLDNLLSVIIIYAGISLPLAIWVLKNFIDTIPFDIEEAALIDGCSRFKSFIKIVLPLIIPGLASVSLIVFIFAWKEYLLASIFLGKNNVQTMTLGLAKWVLQHVVEVPEMSAASVLAMLPLIVILFFAQNLLLKGLTAGAVKQ